MVYVSGTNQSAGLTAGVAVLAVIVCVLFILCVVIAWRKRKMAKGKLNQYIIIAMHVYMHSSMAKHLPYYRLVGNFEGFLFRG